MANEFKIKKGLIVQGSGSSSPVLDIQGSQGQLFSVTDNLSGSLSSVNDISGLPIFEVFSDDTVKMGTYNAEGLIVTGSNVKVGRLSTNIHTLTGSLNITGSVNVVNGVINNLTASNAVSSSFSTTSSYALTASYALNGGGGATFPYVGDAEITGSLKVSGSTNLNGNTTISGSLNVSGTINLSNGSQSILFSNLGTDNIFIGNGGQNTLEGGSYNTSLGIDALLNNTSGSYNTAIGISALYSNTSGSDNTAIGPGALYSNISGNRNTAIGPYSLYSNTTGNNNTATGYNTLTLNDTGYANVANGYGALYHNSSGYLNTANGTFSLIFNEIGYGNVGNGAYTLYSNTSGSKNTANGTYALQANTSGSDNTATGYQSLNENITGNDNVANGVYSLYVNTIGNKNTAIGNSSLRNNTSGSENTSIGYDAARGNITGSYNVANGSYALRFNNNGNYNVGIGYAAGRNIFNGSGTNTNPSNSIFIGANSKSATNNDTNQIVIGYNAIGLGSNTTVLGNTSTISTALYGNLLLGQTTNNGIDKLQVTGTSKLNGNTTISGSLNVSGSIIKNGGTSTQFLKADGSVDSNSYQISLINPITGSGTVNKIPVFNANTGLTDSYLTQNSTGIVFNSNALFGSKLDIQGVNATIYGQNNLIFGVGASEAIYINNSRNVGINTSNPNSKLDVYGTITTSEFKNPILQFISTRTDVVANRNWDIVTNNTSYGTLDIRYSTASNGTPTEIAVTVNSNGNVGIGTTSPTNKFHAYGGTLTVGNENTYSARFSNDSNKGVIIGYDSTNNKGHIGSINPLVAWTDLILNANGGNVGIGIVNPAEKLHIDGNIRFNNLIKGESGKNVIFTGTTSNVFYSGGVDGFGINNSADTVRLVQVTDGGNVGIGTTSPGSKLDVNGNVKVNGFIDAAPFSAFRLFDGTTFTGGLGSTSWANGDGSNRLVLYSTTDVSIYTSGLEVGRWLVNGNLGIGTTSPQQKLHVEGVIQSRNGIINYGDHSNTFIQNILPAAANGGGGGIISLRMWCSEPGITWDGAGFGYNVTNDGGGAYGFSRINSNHGQAYMRFDNFGNWFLYNSNTSGTRTTSITVLSDGKVGIGTTPSAKLDVNGNVNVTGTVTASGGFFNSDIRLKTVNNNTFNVDNLKPISYTWKDGRDNLNHYGYSAQDVEQFMPDAVTENQGIKSVNYIEVLVAKIEMLENRIKELENN